uniref:Uncharacterized protein n=1 Tax=Physcomitrium patens TaxID=3218 RepID=A0A2K1IFA9_PHYPA|nr:hypothetical protein PHYPA_028554 [Physcomitrium patens]
MSSQALQGREIDFEAPHSEHVSSRWLLEALKRVNACFSVNTVHPPFLRSQWSESASSTDCLL